MNRLIRKAIAAWMRHRFLRANPAVKEQMLRYEAARAKHKATKHIERETQKIVLNALRAR